VNGFCDSGTIHRVSFLHAAVTNPSRLDDIVPLEPRKNVNSAADYCLFFQEVDNQLRQNECVLCGTVCDNLRTQVIPAEKFIRDHDGLSMPVMHLACCNQMINLVFLYSLRMDCHSEVKKNSRTLGKFFGPRGPNCLSLLSWNGANSQGLADGRLEVRLFTLS
jgi:hypothetical protein